MGSPVSVTVANLVMEESALASFNTPPRFWKSYVDDTSMALPEDSVSSFHNHLNEHIHFMVEKDGVFPFLDVFLTRDLDGTIKTSVYRKQMHTDTLTSRCITHSPTRSL